MNTCKEAASPLLTTQTVPSGPGVCRRYGARPSSPKGADASLIRPACRPALDPGDLRGPWGRWCGQARACPGGSARHTDHDPPPRSREPKLHDRSLYDFRGLPVGTLRWRCLS